jgi:branched-chain amino acid transport system ATP-binding protein
MLLEVKNLSKRFGGMTAISKVDLAVKAGEVRGLIGPNGSGKSTLFNLISGIYRPEPGGSVLFDGQDVTSCEAHEIARRGIARTFQLLRIFVGMSVLENMLIGHHSLIRYGTASAVLGARRVWSDERRARQEMMELLAFIGLANVDYWRSAAPWRCGRSC